MVRDRERHQKGCLKRPTKLQKLKKYEDKCIREFKNHLMNGPPWLKYDTSIKLMFCRYCKEQGKGGKFASCEWLSQFLN